MDGQILLKVSDFGLARDVCEENFYLKVLLLVVFAAIYTHAYTHAYTHTHTHTHIHTHRHIHTHIHTYTHAPFSTDDCWKAAVQVDEP